MTTPSVVPAAAVAQEQRLAVHRVPKRTLVFAFVGDEVENVLDRPSDNRRALDLRHVRSLLAHST